MNKDKNKKTLDESEIRKSVRDFYTDIATGKKKTNVDSNELNKALGYSKEQLDSVPEEANMGLGCGNPHEKAKPMPGETVLDLGCGKGFDVFIAAKAVGENGYVIGVDSSIDMVEKARYIGTKRKFNNVNFRLGEIEYLPVADNSLDIVISNCVINLSTQKQQVYNEIHRVLKKGGRIGISDITQAKPLPQSVLDNPKMYGTWVAGSVTLDRLIEILKNAGFVNIDIDTKDVTDEYAAKWGITEVNLKDYIRSSTITAFK